ncbi:hypothetical protein TNCV_3331351 [Trichonephila clavipes]|nr:hypothetical protein TNCV_3331351 [Trichonephila clavipes]
MRLSLAIIIVLCIVNLEAKERRNKERNRESRDGSRRNSSKHGGGSRKKQPFHMFESCRDFNVEYLQKMKAAAKTPDVIYPPCFDVFREPRSDGTADWVGLVTSIADF